MKNYTVFNLVLTSLNQKKTKHLCLVFDTIKYGLINQSYNSNTSFTAS